VQNSCSRSLLIYSVVIKILDKKWEYDRAVHQLFIHFKKAYDLIRRDILYNLIEFDIPMKVDSVIRMCLKETYDEMLMG
jgi:hypothetical protein